MSHWNYRIIATEDAEFGEMTYAIHEVFYDDEDNVNGWTKDPVAFVADTKLEVLDALAKASASGNRPVLWCEGDELKEVAKDN